MKFSMCLVLALAAVVSCQDTPKKVEKRGIVGGYGLPLGTIGLGGIPLGLSAPIAPLGLGAPIAPLGLGIGSPYIASGLPLTGLPLSGLPLSYGLGGLPLSTYGLGGLPIGGLGLGGIHSIL